MTNDPIVHPRQSKKWAAGTRTFRSSVTKHPTRGTQTYIPAPIMEMWGMPDSVIYQVQGDQVVIRKGKSIK